MEKNLDYIYFLKENETILEELKEHNTTIYQMFHPILNVLDFLAGQNLVVDNLDINDAEKIFNEGYFYLYNSVLTIKDILSNLFNDDIEYMIHFEKEICLLLKVDEIDYLTDGKNPVLSSIYDNLYSMLKERRKTDKLKLDLIESLIKEAFRKEEEKPISEKFLECDNNM